MTEVPLHYLDSGIFSAFLNGPATEPEAFHDCEAIIRAAERGLIRVCTSTMTTAEVVYIQPWPGKAPLPVDVQEEVITQLLSSSWIEWGSFEPDMARIHRRLLREHAKGRGKRGLQLLDAVHLATAIRLGADFFNTLDETLIKCVPEAVNCPPRYPKPVIVQRPFVDKFQMSIPDLDL